eukprot:919542-Amphidinium_carterae.2
MSTTETTDSQYQKTKEIDDDEIEENKLQTTKHYLHFRTRTMNHSFTTEERKPYDNSKTHSTTTAGCYNTHCTKRPEENLTGSTNRMNSNGFETRRALHATYDQGHQR